MSAHRAPLSAPLAGASESERFEALYRDFAPRLLSILSHGLRLPRAKVEDGCQQAWGILAGRLDVLDGPNPRAWLVTVARHECFREFRTAPAPVADADDRHSAPPLDDLIEARAALRQVAALRPVRKRVFERHLAGFTYDEIATELGVTYTNVNRHVTESRAELRAAA
jgi:RNA polymerase sigma factor (sigma-70 family)